jgi:hypothetical protein
MPYLITSVGMAIVAGLTVMGIIALRPEYDVLLVVSAVFAAYTSTTLSLLAYMKAQETHLSVNSQLDKWMAGAQEHARSTGLIEGRANERADNVLESSARRLRN